MSDIIGGIVFLAVLGYVLYMLHPTLKAVRKGGERHLEKEEVLTEIQRRKHEKMGFPKQETERYEEDLWKEYERLERNPKKAGRPKKNSQ